MTEVEAEQYERHLASGCEACHEELRRAGRVGAQLAMLIEPHAPPPNVREALLARAAGQLAGVSQRQAAGAAHDDARAHDHEHDEHAADQVWKKWAEDDAQQELVIRRCGQDDWQETGVPGVRVRRLFVDRERNQFTAVVRMDPGTAYPRHVHNGPEECLVLSGDLHVGETVMHAGDYQRASAGSHHGIQRTEGGCELLIISSLSDEVY